MTKKVIRLLALILVLTLSFSLFSATAYASINSSAYISMTSASATKGSSAGKINVHYSITGMGMMDTIGVLCIDVYKSNGVLYKTIYGSTSNGLLINNDFVHAGTYTVTCVSGNAYYCEVTLYAAKNGGYDTRTIQTQTVVAPTSP